MVKRGDVIRKAFYCFCNPNLHYGHHMATCPVVPALKALKELERLEFVEQTEVRAVVMNCFPDRESGLS